MDADVTDSGTDEDRTTATAAPAADDQGTRTPGTRTPAARTPGAHTPTAHTSPARTPSARTPGAGAPAPSAANSADAATSSGGADAEPPGAPPAPDPESAPRHPRPPRSRRRRRWMRLASLVASLLVLTAAGVGWTLYNRLDGNIRTDDATARDLKDYEAQRPDRPTGEAENILLLGSDSRLGGNSAYGRDQGGQHSDTAILLHVAADHRSATGVSIPRDLMVRVPSCTGRDGVRTKARFTQFNSAFQNGGAACAIRTVETLTGLRVDHHLVVDFTGFKSLVDTVGGVEVCLPGAVRDRDAKLELAAGRQTLGGEDALGYVRARHGLGNGSDTDRMSRQQQFLGSLVKKVRSNGVLLNPAKLYPVLHSATSAVTADEGLDSLGELYELARGVRDIPEEQVRFLTVPRQSYRLDRNRDELVQPDAGRLFAQLRADRTVRIGEQGDGGTGTSGGGTAAPESGTAASRSSRSPDQTGRNQAAGGAVRPSVRQDAESPAPDGSGRPGKPAPVYRGTTAARDVCRT
ncbi:LCP family protein [Streptomyces marispadix]|uniref:LCP family protein n=1 Tax=Streptomyces marispadix TaxID=2922868 RepID=A0ABS9SWI5_9ACTN|nr:LCP family protein [Streptomyces marispadix]MCH6160632.1 LCP family protein [Streptomyces marispadix]